MTSSPIYALVMAGGSGTRFWPASREARPKQYLPIAGGKPMLVETVDRLAGLVDPAHILVVTSAAQAALVRECLPDLPEENLIQEPKARNTAPCVALGAMEVLRRDPRAVQIVLPADHVIEPRAAFERSVRAAAEEAQASASLVTLGIKPDHPATGYGYIQAAAELGRRDGCAVHQVVRFVEKPDAARAAQFLAQGGFFWNAGIFVWSGPAIDAALRTHMPDVVAGLERAFAGGDLTAEYARFAAVPIDVALLERADNVRVVPVDYSWSDVGSWAALAELAPQGEGGNRTALSGGARLIAEDAHDCLAYAEGDELIALVGVQNLVVVRAGNATLVCPRERAQDVKRIVERLRAAGDQRFL